MTRVPRLSTRLFTAAWVWMLASPAYAQVDCAADDVPPEITVGRPVVDFPLGNGWLTTTVAEACELSWVDTCTPAASAIHGINELESLSGEIIGGEPGAWTSPGLTADWQRVNLDLDPGGAGPRAYRIRYAVIDHAWNWSYAECTLRVTDSAPDICDGIDSDGDGAIDEDFATEPLTCGIGACAATGQTACVDGAVIEQCVPGASVAELCGDGVDNDCDGTADEDCGAPVEDCGADVVPPSMSVANPVVTYVLGETEATDGGWLNAEFRDACGITWTDGCTTPDGIIDGVNALTSPTGEVIGGEPGSYSSDGIWADWRSFRVNLDPAEIGAREYLVRYAAIDRAWNWAFAECEIHVVDAGGGCDDCGGVVEDCANDLVPPQVTVGEPAPRFSIGEGWIDVDLRDVCELTWSDGCTAGEGMIHGINTLTGPPGEPIAGEPGGYVGPRVAADWYRVQINVDRDEVEPRNYAIRYAVIDRAWNWSYAECTLRVVDDADPCNGIDDDGDGEIDESFSPTRVTCGEGACAGEGQTACVDGAIVDECSPPGAAELEQCGNGVDDDCDGAVDEAECAPAPCSADVDCESGEICDIEASHCAVPFYVSTQGDDAWSGGLADPVGDDGPFATLAAARDVVGAAKDAGLDRPVTVFVRGGTYWLTETLVFGPDDSGTTAAPVTYAAYPGETPVLSGGEVLAGFGDVSPALGETEIVLPAVRDGEWTFRQLFVNGVRQPRVRRPASGFYTTETPVVLDAPASFRYRAGDVDPAWAASGDVDLVGLARWSMIHAPIVAVDAASQTVTLGAEAPQSGFADVDSPRYYVENAPGPVTHGEWHLARDTGTLRYSNIDDWFDDGDGPRSPPLEAVAPRLETLIDLRGDPEQARYVEHLHLRGLTLSHTRAPRLDEGYGDHQAAHRISGAVMLNGARYCSVRRNTFTRLGNYGLHAQQSCTDVTVAENTFRDLGAGGIRVGRASDAEDIHATTQRITVEDNLIEDIGRVYPTAVGIWIGPSHHNRIAHNEIRDTYYTGISVGWTWNYGPSGAHDNLVELNHIHDIGRNLLSDMGGVYTLGVQPGTRVVRNLVHDIATDNYGGWGLYADAGSSEIEFAHNIVYGAESASFHQNFGRANSVQNNVLAFGHDFQLMRTQSEAHVSFTFERNIVYWDEGELLGSNWTGAGYVFDANLYWHTQTNTPTFSDLSFAAWQNRGQDSTSVIADPRFVDAAAFDFDLRPDSPALGLGFEPIDLSTVGPRTPPP